MPDGGAYAGVGCFISRCSCEGGNIGAEEWTEIDQMIIEVCVDPTRLLGGLGSK